jgi:drug/metabolite transporter (DMT)-like permease
MDWNLLQSGEFSATLCGLLWAVAVILFKKSGETVPPVTLNLFKGTVGLVLFVITMLVLDLPFFPATASRSDWIILLVSGAIGIGIADSLLFAALNRLGAGRNAIVDCLYSPFVILCSIVYLSEPLSIWLFVAIGLMVGAIGIGTWNPAKLVGVTDRRALRTGVLMGVASQLLMAIGIVMVKPVLETSEVWWATSVRLVGGWSLLAVQGLLPRHRPSVWRAFSPGREWTVTMPAAVIGTYLSLIFWILGMKYTYTTIASVLNQMSVIFMLLLATLFLKEPLTGRKLVAITMGFAAGLVATF